MNTFKVGDKVIRSNTGTYNLSKTDELLKDYFPGICHASTTQMIGDAEVILSDDEGALIRYTQNGKYSDLGYLYFPNKALELVKPAEPVIINNYSIY